MPLTSELVFTRNFLYDFHFINKFRPRNPTAKGYWYITFISSNRKVEINLEVLWDSTDVVHGVLPTTQFSYQKSLGTSNALLCVSHTLQSALESGQYKLGSYRLISVLPLIGSTIREFSISSALWVLEIQSRLYIIDTVSIKPITARYCGWLAE